MLSERSAVHPLHFNQGHNSIGCLDHDARIVKGKLGGNVRDSAAEELVYNLIARLVFGPGHAVKAADGALSRLVINPAVYASKPTLHHHGRFVRPDGHLDGD